MKDKFMKLFTDVKNLFIVGILSVAFYFVFHNYWETAKEFIFNLFS